MAKKTNRGSKQNQKETTTKETLKKETSGKEENGLLLAEGNVKEGKQLDPGLKKPIKSNSLEEGAMEVDCNTEGKVGEQKKVSLGKETKVIEKETKTVENVTKTVQEVSKTVENETKTVENETKTVENENKTVENENKTVENENKTVENENKTVENENKTVENKTKTVENKTKAVDSETKTVDSETKTVENETTEEKENDKSPVKVVETVLNDDISDDESDDKVEITGSKEGDRVKKKHINEEKSVEYGNWTVESRLETFSTWAQSKGVSLSSNVKVSCEGTAHRYGLLATDDIKKGETLVTIPREVMLHPDNSRIVAELVDYEDWLDSIGQSLDDSSGWATLLISLMVEFNDHESYWAPYLRLVPQVEEFGHAIFWNNEEINEELKGTTLLYDVQRDIYNIEAEYKQYILPFIYRYKDICGRVDRYNVDIYKRLVAFVMAYSFTEGSDTQPAMIPMADLMNHNVNNNAHLVFEEEIVKVVACKNIKKGEEIYQSFGKLGNAELLQMYGYAELKPNIFDCLPILVTTFLDVMETLSSASDMYFQAKVALLNKTEVAISDDYFLFDRNGLRKGPDIVQMLKILCMPEMQFENLLKMRSSNRPDSFYKKLLRKLNLAKKTDASSGVAIIDITDEDQDMDAVESGDNHDKEDTEKDLEPPTKRQMIEGENDTTLQNVSSTGGLVNGNSISNAIVIDESDDDDNDDDDDDKGEKETKEADKNDPSENKLAVESSKDSTKCVEMLDDSNSEKGEIGSSDGAKEDQVKEDQVKEDKTEEDKTEEDKDYTKADKEKDENDEKDGDTQGSKDIEKDSVKGSKDIEKDSVKDSTVLIDDSSLSINVSMNDDVDIGDDDENDSDADDVEFVSEDIRCKMTYERLSKEMNPEWKSFVKNVIDCYVKTLKEDEEDALEEAKKSMSHRQLCAYLVREGQRNIAEKFLAVLST